MTVKTDPIVDLLTEIRDSLHRLEAAQTQRSSRLSRADRQRLERLLPAIAGVQGSTSFVVNEVIDLPPVRLVLGDLSARSLGRLLQRATSIPIDTYMVERVGDELHRVLWRIVQTP